MTKSGAVNVLETISTILYDVTRYDMLSSSQRSSLRSNAMSERNRIDEVIRLIKKLDREARAE